MKTIAAFIFLLTTATFLQPIPAALAAPIKSANAMRQTQSAAQIFDLLDQRLSLMRAVALAKWNNRSAIEDLPREKIVVANARRNAARAGLRDVDSLTRTQIEMAKEIQRHWHRRWTHEGLPKNQTAPALAEVRGELEKIDGQILEIFPIALPALHNAKQEASLRRLFLQRVKNGAFSNVQRGQLFQAVLKVENEKS